MFNVCVGGREVWKDSGSRWAKMLCDIFIERHKGWGYLMKGYLISWMNSKCEIPSILKVHSLKMSSFDQVKVKLEAKNLIFFRKLKTKFNLSRTKSNSRINHFSCGQFIMFGFFQKWKNKTMKFNSIHVLEEKVKWGVREKKALESRTRNIYSIYFSPTFAPQPNRLSNIAYT